MKRGGSSSFAIACLLASAAGFAAEPAAPAKRTLQQDFDAATTAALENRCAEAIPLFEALEKDARVKPGSLPAAAIALRKGVCQIELGGGEEAEASVLAGIGLIEASGPTFAQDVYDGHRVLGMRATLRDDYAAARRHYETALAKREGLNRLNVLMALTLVTAFDGTDTPIAFADEALGIIAAQPQPSKELRASFLTARARVRLNQGQVEPAYKDLKEALKLSGGLTLKTTLNEVRMRYDLAQAALLAGDTAEANRYLAYTGAGRVGESPFSRAAAMDVPVCGEETGLQPGDQAVVEFSIDPDGSVKRAQTIYTKGSAAVAAAFANAVRQWFWNPEDVAKIPPFYLNASRVELRCTTAGAEAPGILGPLRRRIIDWVAHESPQLPPGGPIQLLGLEGSTGIIDPTQMEQALASARGANAPTGVVNALLVFQALMGPADKNDYITGQQRRAFARATIALAGKEPFASDALAAGVLRLSGARTLQQFKDSAPVIAELKQVAEDTRLPEHDPLRQVAYLQLADVAARAGDLDGASGYFERSGLTEEQCAMLGVSPALKSSNASGSDFPRQALMMGFEGWVKVEFDIDADGRTTNGRPVIAYPPFVFSDGVTEMSRDFRYRSSYRPSGSMACSAHSENVVFKLD